MSHLFSDILDSIGNAFSHLSNANFGTLAVVAVVIILFGILLLRR